MARSRQAVVAEYVEARRDVALYRKQLAQFPELGRKPGFLRHLNEAVAAADALLRGMTGGEIGRAQRLLAAAPNEEPTP